MCGVSRVSAVLLVCCWGAALATLAPSKGKKSHVKSGPVPQDVFQRNLVVDNPLAKDILNNHQAYCNDTARRRAQGIVLGYVTPWNSHGYDVAKLFANKLTHVSPVWLQVSRTGERRYELTGTHDIDKGWMKDVRKAAHRHQVKILPRVLFDSWSNADLERLLSSAAEMEALGATLEAACVSWRLDGLVLEVWAQVAGRAPASRLEQLVRTLGRRLLAGGLEAVLAVPPPRSIAPFDAPHLHQLAPHLTAFSLMTYDYSSPQRPGPNGPAHWARAAVERLDPGARVRSQLLLGLNLYGNEYTGEGGGPILAPQYLSLLGRLKGRLNYDNVSEEHWFEVKDSYGRHAVFYPTLFSLERRLRLARDLGTGLALWELGQGLDYFYDLF